MPLMFAYAMALLRLDISANASLTDLAGIAKRFSIVVFRAAKFRQDATFVEQKATMKPALRIAGES